MDALQAFVCAIQIDNKHATAWLNLGILYESSGYTQDALICYRKAIQEKDGTRSECIRNSFIRLIFLESWYPELITRMNKLQNYLSKIPEQLLDKQ